MADSNRIQISYALEQNWGEIPAAADFRELLITGGSLAHALETTRSATVRSDAQAAQSLRTAADATATLNAELSAADLDVFMLAAVRDPVGWPADLAVADDTLSAFERAGQVAGYYRYSGGFFPAGVLDEGWYYVGGFTATGNNGWKKADEVVNENVGTLGAAINEAATDITLGANATITVAVDDLLQIEDEVVLVTAVNSQTQFTVTRAQQGTAAAAHAANIEVDLYRNRLNVRNDTGMADEGAGDDVTINGSVIRNGAALRSFALQEQYRDLTNRYIQAEGMRLPTFSLDIQPGSIITCAFEFTGAEIRQAALAAGSGVIVPASGNNVMSEVDSFGDVWVDDALVQWGMYQLSTNMTSPARPQTQLGRLRKRGIGLGAFAASGSIQAYLEDDSWSVLGDLYSFTKRPMAFSLQDVAGNRYLIEFFQAVLTSEPGEIPGTDQDKFIAFDFDAEPGGDVQKTVQITRVAA